MFFETGAGGLCIWFTGLSGAGKSTTARALLRALTRQARAATLLDGDEVRKAVSSDLGFSKRDRDVHVMRVARLASEVIARNDVAICALISPFRAARARARALIGADRFIEVFVDAPIQLCQARDPKGLYAQHSRGELIGLTGIDAPYEPPRSPDLILPQGSATVEDGVRQLLALLARRGFANHA